MPHNLTYAGAARRRSGVAGLATALVILGATAGLAQNAGRTTTQTDAPMSAIDWLSKSVATPAVLPVPSGRANDVSSGAAPESVSTQALDAPRNDAAGLLPPAVTGLPRGLWGETPTETLIHLITGARLDAVPAVQDLLYTLLMAELDPPYDSTGEGRLFLARVDKLLDLGALDQARALLDIAGTETPEAFRRWFDIALLLGDEDRACETLRNRPDIAPTFPARVFCLARGGDWNAAALSLRTGEALGFVTLAEANLMSRFLDPGLYEDEEMLPPPVPMTPLTWRMLEAIDEPSPTNTLPVAFAQADLRSNAGWKAQIEAAERLARLGAVPGNRLLGLYTAGRPAASGGVWDRVRAMQAFDQAMASGDGLQVAPALAAVWPQMQASGLEVPFAELYGARLRAVGLTGEAAELAFRIGLLSADYEEISATAPPGVETAFLVGLARGNITGLAAPNAIARAIAAGFAAVGPPEALGDLVAEDRLGEALLRAMDKLADGGAGDLRAVSESIALLRHVGLEDTVRRTSLQLMLMDWRG